MGHILRFEILKRKKFRVTSLFPNSIIFLLNFAYTDLDTLLALVWGFFPVSSEIVRPVILQKKLKAMQVDTGVQDCGLFDWSTTGRKHCNHRGAEEDGADTLRIGAFWIPLSSMF